MKRFFPVEELHVFYRVSNVQRFWDGAWVWEYTLDCIDEHPEVSKFIPMDKYGRITETKPLIPDQDYVTSYGIADGDRVSVVFKNGNPSLPSSQWQPIPVDFYKP